ncbi:RES family NAD+ phosphorylase [Gallaecimonas kandeliae]|uniref:RES family NAD+ phosphorylase n=1 Tax=Gallaecimonas kandeliae TaxID=3029055 RepID=UPI0026499A2C|nr:RES family NAD+ phosphorylase [Gallaecimonas kandeliae]WKE64092.1 RES family NAD+ phosphorylase [Gallaecimonas kandeliae]
MQPIQGLAWRLVESQEQVATSHLVDSLAEQQLLEDLLDYAKPPRLPGTEHLHYLLATPFRYPPLPWGSRFGRSHEPSLFYAGKSINVTLTEGAYYRLVFWHSMSEPPPSQLLRTQHHLFAFHYRTGKGEKLQDWPKQEQLTDPVNYGHCQALGSRLRADGVEAFEYRSARSEEGELNVALFTPKALVSQRPKRLSRWLCEVSGAGVTFLGGEGNDLYLFPAELFEVEGLLPLPA